MVKCPICRQNDICCGQVVCDICEIEEPEEAVRIRSNAPVSMGRSVCEI